jgi:AcrR family transcriptional regulator
MAKTKQKILDTALELFNSLGLAKVTLRTIAKEIGISQGNLNYHFKKREDIIEALYFELVNELNAVFELKKETSSLFEALFGVSKKIMNGFFDYRFIFLDFVQLMREHKNIKEHYLQLTEQREIQVMQLFQLLIEDGFLREPILENEYENLYKTTQIVSDFWISSAIISSKDVSRSLIVSYSKLINQHIFPYLTEKGRSEYHAILKNKL